MQPQLICVTPETATLEIASSQPWRSPGLHRISLTGAAPLNTDRNVVTLHDLRSDSEYECVVEADGERAAIAFRTLPVRCRIDIRVWSAKIRSWSLEWPAVGTMA